MRRRTKEVTPEPIQDPEPEQEEIALPAGRPETDRERLLRLAKEGHYPTGQQPE